MYLRKAADRTLAGSPKTGITTNCATLSCSVMVRIQLRTAGLLNSGIFLESFDRTVAAKIAPVRRTPTSARRNGIHLYFSVLHWHVVEGAREGRLSCARIDSRRHSLLGSSLF